jgi:hypothetical protein
MNEALKTVEHLINFSHQEVNRLKSLPGMSDKAYDALRIASIQLIDVGRNVSLARGWNLTVENDNEKTL